MKLGRLAAKSLLRNKVRTSLTVLGVAIAVLTFVLLRTIISAWTVAADHAAKDRVVTRHKVTFIMPLPKRYIDEVRQLKGVKEATFANWFGAKDPKHEREFFGTLAVDTNTFLSVYDEMLVPPDQIAGWKKERQGAIVGDVLAKKLGWKVGDRVTLQGSIFPGDWPFTISGIYTATRKSVDRSTFFFHWDYMNQSIPEARRDQIGWVVFRVDDPTRSADLAQVVDRHFDTRDVQTLSQSERAFNLSFLGMISTVLKAIDIISIVILAIMMLVLGNTIAMGVRERINEHGVLRAIGFSPMQIASAVVMESVVLGLLGGGVGLLIAYPFLEKGLGRWLEENLGALFPFVRVGTSTAILALGLAVLLSLVASLPPAYRAFRLRVVDALRRIG
ncbi:MAG: ABC transporter permease [Deltaproteobacteria bacterium]|nr:ABC transporter permease [Deltaproteobacteria bacterium]